MGELAGLRPRLLRAMIRALAQKPEDEMRALFIAFLICLGATCALAVVSAPSVALDNTAPRPADIEGRQWHIVHYVIDASHEGRDIRRKGKPYITFAGGAIEGSPGCGRFNGVYRRSGEQLTIAVGWTDDEEKPCNDKEKERATNILRGLTNVRQIQVEPEYWRSDALLLNDGKGTTQVTLSPMQTGNDLSELEDTFWHLTQLESSNADFADVIINIGEGRVTFTTPSDFISYPFRYKLAGLEFFPAFMHFTASQKDKLFQDEQIATAFEKGLHKIASYELSQGSLTFFGKDRKPIMVINSFPQTTIENRRWRITKYRGDSTQQADKDGLLDANEYSEVTFLNGRVNGSPGCGGWVGTYRLSGNQLTFDAGLALLGYCPPEDMAQDRLVEKAFRAAVRIEEKGDYVLLRDKDGKAQILLVPY